MIADSIFAVPLIESSITDRCKIVSYDISTNVLNYVMSLTSSSSIAFLFSGSWRLNIDAVYLELKVFQSCQVNWHPNTLFIEPQQQDFYHYTLSKLRCDNIIILHSDFWCAHRPIETIINDLGSFRQYAPRVICSIPVRHLNFNKLTNSIQDLCNRIDGTSVCDDSFVIVR